MQLQVAQLVKDAARLTTEGDEARAAIADANARALEAKLELERFRAPRSLSTEQQSRITEKLKAFSGTKFDTAAFQDAEPAGLMAAIEAALIAAGWVQVDWKGTDLVLNRPGRPVAGISNVPGVVIAIELSQVAELQAKAEQLMSALNAEGMAAKGVAEPLATINTNPEAIHVLIGRKQ